MNKDFDKIDDIFREALHDFEVEYNPQDWQDFEQHLDNELAVDKAAEEALQHYEVAYTPLAWQEFEQQLDSEMAMDQAAQNALKDLDVPYEEADWKSLEKQLDRNEHLYPYIWRTKGIEVGVIALFIFTFLNLTINNKYGSLLPFFSGEETIKTTETTTDEHTPATLNEHTYSTSTEENQSQDNGQTQEELNNPQAFNLSSEEVNTTDGNGMENNVADISNEYSDETATTNNSVSNNSASDVSDDANASNTTAWNEDNKENVDLNSNNSGGNNNDGTVISTSITNADDSNNSNTLNNRATEDVATKDASDNENEDANAADNNNAKALSNKPTLRTFTETANFLFKDNMLFALDVENQKLKHNDTDPLFELKNVTNKSKYICKVHIGGAASADANLATSMGGTSIGYSAGLFLDIECSPRVFVKTGLFASHKKFFNEQDIVLDQTAIDGNIYNVNKIVNTNLAVLQMPIDVQYIFFQNEKWRIYASAGITSNLVAGRIYTGEQSTAHNGMRIKTAINSNDYDRGALEGGNFLDNFYLTAGGGIGLERQLGDNVSIYLLPIYKHGITTFGPNKDRINTFSINVGLKTNL